MDPIHGVRALRSLVAVLVLALIAGGCFSADETAATIDATPTAQPPLDEAPQLSASAEAAPEIDDGWDPLLADLALFVEQTRGEEFLIISDVDFVDADELLAQLRRQGPPSLDALPPQLRDTFELVDDFYRSAGLHDGEFELLAVQQALATNIFAFYDPQRRAIVYPTPGGAAKSEFSAPDRVVIVHELSHALQGQSRWTRVQSSTHPPELKSALLEGEAEWVAAQYIDQLDDAEQRDWDAFRRERRGPVEGVPDIYLADFGQAYELGHRFFEVQYALEGIGGIQAAFDNRWIGANVLLDPWATDSDRRTYADYDLPSVPGLAEEDEIRIRDFVFSPTRFNQLFSPLMSGEAAMTAARGIVSTTSATLWRNDDDQVCFATNVLPGPGDDDVVLDALTAWTAVAPEVRSVARNGQVFLLQGCEIDGLAVERQVSPLGVLNRTAAVIDAELWAYEHGLDPAVGFCVGWDHIARNVPDGAFRVEEFVDDLTVDDIPAHCQSG